MVNAPLHIRIPVEYVVVLALSAVVAWLYANFAKASFMLALGLGIAMLVAIQAFIWYVAKRAARKAMLHPITLGLLALTAAYAFDLIRVG